MAIYRDTRFSAARAPASDLAAQDRTFCRLRTERLPAIGARGFDHGQVNPSAAKGNVLTDSNDPIRLCLNLERVAGLNLFRHVRSSAKGMSSVGPSAWECVLFTSTHAPVGVGTRRMGNRAICLEISVGCLFPMVILGNKGNRAETVRPTGVAPLVPARELAEICGAFVRAVEGTADHSRLMIRCGEGRRVRLD